MALSTSETVNIPPPNKLLQEKNGFLTYRLAFTSLRVTTLDEGGAVIDVTEDGHLIRLRLDAEQVGHLIDLLRPGANS